MFTRSAMVIVGGLVAVVVFLADSSAHAESWKPALRDADELYDAAEDLHDRAVRLRELRVIPLTASLEGMTSELYQQLKQHACAADVVPLLNATGNLLSEVTAMVTLSCDMRDDRKSRSELENARRYFAGTSKHIECLLHDHGHSSLYPTVHAVPYPAVQHPTVQHPTVPHHVAHGYAAHQDDGHQHSSRGARIQVQVLAGNSMRSAGSNLYGYGPAPWSGHSHAGVHGQGSAHQSGHDHEHDHDHVRSEHSARALARVRIAPMLTR